MLDRYVEKTKTDRVNPENETIPIFLADETFFLGAAAYVARIASSFGAKSHLFGVIGRDIYGREIKTLCQKSGVITHLISDGKTIVKERHYTVLDSDNSKHYRERLDYSESQPKINEKIQEKILKSLTGMAESLDLFIFPDYDKRIFSEIFSRKLISLAKTRDILVVVDPKPKNIAFFEGCEVVCPNKKEAQEITGIEYSNEKDVLFRMGKTLQERVKSKYVIITCGEGGAYFYNGNSAHSKMIPSFYKKPVDVTGAGDVFETTFALGLAYLKKNKLNENDYVYELVRLANAAAASVVDEKGTVIPNREKIRQILIS